VAGAARRGKPARIRPHVADVRRSKRGADGRGLRREGPGPEAAEAPGPRRHNCGATGPRPRSPRATEGVASLEVLLLGARDVLRLLPPADCVEAMAGAFGALARGAARSASGGTTGSAAIRGRRQGDVGGEAGTAARSASVLASRRRRRHNGAMPSVQIKAVPDDVHAILRGRAAAEGKSLQEYLLARLTAEARRPTLDEVLARAGRQSGGSVPFDAAVHAIRAERDAR